MGTFSPTPSDPEVNTEAFRRLEELIRRLTTGDDAAQEAMDATWRCLGRRTYDVGRRWNVPGVVAKTEIETKEETAIITIYNYIQSYIV